MQIDDFDFALPPELIAQEPVTPRDQSRLLVLDRSTGALASHIFAELPQLLAPGDLLVLNDTRVVAARLVGVRPATQGKWEGLFVREHDGGLWELLLQTRGKLAEGDQLQAGTLALELVRKLPSGRWLLRPGEPGPFAEVLARHGQVPIPPYIRKGRADREDEVRYQTIHARSDGAVAAPTAGLHFTQELFDRLQAIGIERAFVTLHVGPGTFQPVKVDDVRQHRVEAEWGELPPATAEAIARCKARGGRVVAVGTTTVRVMESAGPQSLGWSGLTDLTICPPYTFRVVDALITNFHLPRSSLLLLVSAFASLEQIRRAYAEAIRLRYRFYSYGDAMLILGEPPLSS
ncbi:MAG: tRNA preQ1(34) S-adenosylmethionine ribosyltransferase-isomerase QueA [Gemmataceae bacterium]